MQDDETYVLCAVGKLIKRYNIILYQTTRIFSLTPCGTLYTKPRRPPLRSSSVLKRNEKNPTTINTYLRENEIFGARKGQGRRRQRRIIILYKL